MNPQKNDIKPPTDLTLTKEKVPKNIAEAVATNIIFIFKSGGWGPTKHTRICKDKQDIKKCANVWRGAREKLIKDIQNGKPLDKSATFFFDNLFIASISNDPQDEKNVNIFLKKVMEFIRKYNDDFYDITEFFNIHYTYFEEILGIDIPENNQALPFFAYLIDANHYITLRYFIYILDKVNDKDLLNYINGKGTGLRASPSIHKTLFFMYMDSIGNHKNYPYFKQFDFEIPDIVNNTEYDENNTSVRNFCAKCLRFVFQRTEYITEYGTTIIPYDVDRETFILNKLIDIKNFNIAEYINKELKNAKQIASNYLYLSEKESKSPR